MEAGTDPAVGIGGGIIVNLGVGPVEAVLKGVKGCGGHFVG